MTSKEETEETSSSYLDRDRREAEEESKVMNAKSVVIVVLGDIGRSPRMRFHALSLAKEGYLVHMIGYGGSALPKDLAKHKAIRVNNMLEPPDFFQGIVH